MMARLWSVLQWTMAQSFNHSWQAHWGCFPVKNLACCQLGFCLKHTLDDDAGMLRLRPILLQIVLSFQQEADRLAAQAWKHSGVLFDFLPLVVVPAFHNALCRLDATQLEACHDGHERVEAHDGGAV